MIYAIVDDWLRSQKVPERFAIQLWASNPHSGNLSLELWGSSEKVWLVPETLLSAPIVPESQYNAVRAFCSGGVLIEGSRKSGSRWKRSVSCLTYLEGNEWQYLPVGAIVLESDHDADSCLNKLEGAQREGISALLRAAGEALLDPSVDVDQFENALDDNDITRPASVDRVAASIKLFVRDARRKEDWSLAPRLVDRVE